MQKTEQLILDLFRKHSNEELSTSSIVSSVEPSYTEMELVLKDKYSSREKIKKSKRSKAKLHRKILYYLTKLTSQETIKLAREGRKGEKFFILNVEPYDLELSYQPRRIIQPKLSVPIEGYEQQGIIHRLEASTWIERLNSVLIEATFFNNNIKKLSKFVEATLPVVNDVLCINNFESLTESYKDLIIFLTRLNSKCSDYGKKVSLNVNFSNNFSKADLFQVIKEVVESNFNNFTFIFDIKPKNLQDNHSFFEKIASLFMKHTLPIYIKNQSLTEAPYILGRAGPYTFSDEEWKIYLSMLKKELYGIVCAQSTIMVDIERFFSSFGESQEVFNDFLKKIADSLLETNSLQRRKSEELFDNLVKLDGKNIRTFFSLGKNYIRFWNYGWKKLNFSQDYLIDLFKEARNEVNKFTIFEETIYKSCGMPTRFNIAFSSCFEDFVKNIFTQPVYKKVELKTLQDLFNNEMKEVLTTKERLFEVFDGGDQTSFHRRLDASPEDIIREINFILTSYRIPFFKFNFAGKREQNLTLDSFAK